MGMPRVGQWAEIQQPVERWLPFLITAVIDENTVSGVAFHGQPPQVGWHRPVQDFAHVKRGDRNREWREVELPVAQGETADALTERMRKVAEDVVAAAKPKPRKPKADPEPSPE